MSAARILVVEDNAATRKMMRLALQAEGYSVLDFVGACSCVYHHAAGRPRTLAVEMSLA